LGFRIADFGFRISALGGLLDRTAERPKINPQSQSRKCLWLESECESFLPEKIPVPSSKQISVFLENKPGRLANVLLALAREKVNITALTVMDSHEHSVLRLVADDTARAVQVIKSLGTPHAETEVLLVELRNQPGALAHVCEVLAAAHVTIEYAYCSSGGRNGRVFGIFRVSHTDKAIRALGEAGTNSSRKRLERRPLRDRRTYQAR
jgi:hypothetical protein